MKTTLAEPRARQRGWALLIVMSLAATGLMLVASTMTWSNENAAVTARNSEYFATTYAAEAATEKPLAAIVQDDQNYGEGLVLSKAATSAYSSLIPTPADGSYWTNYHFSGGTTPNAVIVNCINTATTNVLGPPYSGLQCVGATYEIIANAKNANSLYGITATVGQQVMLGQIPIFQFAIFYNDTLEIDPGAAMTISGNVHGNTNIYIDPGASLTFTGNVTATGILTLSANPSDPQNSGTSTTVTWGTNSTHAADQMSLNLPVGTNTAGNTTNVGASVNAILQVPAPGESPNSAIGTNRLYNQVDMIVSISNGNVITVTSGVDVNNAATTISNNQWSSFISTNMGTNGLFYNMRDGSEVAPVDISVGALRQWSATNTVLRPLLSSLRGASQADVQSIFVVDQRFLSNAVVTTNYSYTTNTSTVTSGSYPGTGTYLPPVTTNTTVTSAPAFPGAGTYIPPISSTNTTSTTTTNRPAGGTYVGSISTNTAGTTTASHPSSGTYQGSVTTNVTSTTTSSLPSPGTYTGTITTNKTHGTITGYTYNLITGYTYNLIEYTYNLISGYIFNAITGYTYAGITGVSTNASYLTNYVEYAEPGVVLTNGGTLPASGLSVVTPDPAYIVGNWNCTNNSGQGMTQTANVADTLPSAVYADAVTILSPAWKPNNPLGTASAATPDTVNAAILTGIVPSVANTYYSGGVENFPRFQENWSGVNFYYNGSMVEMFVSRIADSPWPGTGSPNNVYNPPNRNWSFDTNFTNPANLPPLTPRVIYLNRARWATLPPGSTSF